MDLDIAAFDCRSVGKARRDRPDGEFAAVEVDLVLRLLQFEVDFDHAAVARVVRLDCEIDAVVRGVHGVGQLTERRLRVGGDRGRAVRLVRRLLFAAGGEQCKKAGDDEACDRAHGLILGSVAARH